MSAWVRSSSILAAVLALVWPALGAPPGAPPYEAATPMTAPTIFAPGVVSTSDDEFGGAFTPDGATVFFDKTVLRHYLYVICESHFRNGRWSTPEVAPFSGTYRDSDPVLSPDGRTLYFVSDRPVDGKPKTDFDVWKVTRTASGWSEPERLPPPVNGDSGEYFASEAANGDLYFSSDRAGGAGGLDVYRSRLVDGAYTSPENLGAEINSGAWELDCLVAPDESFLIVGAIGRSDSFGNYDLYVSYRKDGAWTPLRNLGPGINTTAREYSPRLSPDGKYLFFTSEKGFATDPPAKAMTTEQFDRGIRSLQNGAGNIYQIDLGAAGIGAPAGR